MDDPAATSIVCASRAYQIDQAKLRRVSDKIKASLGVGDHHLSVALVGSRRIRTLNREFRGKDQATDVLSFPQIDWGAPLAVRPTGNGARRGRGKRGEKPPAGARASDAGVRAPAPVLGDVVISLPEAARSASKLGQGVDREVCFLLVHGILHLCGHDHEVPQDERRMRAAQRTLMRLIGRGWASSVKPRRGR